MAETIRLYSIMYYSSILFYIQIHNWYKSAQVTFFSNLSWASIFMLCLSWVNTKSDLSGQKQFKERTSHFDTSALCMKNVKELQQKQTVQVNSVTTIFGIIVLVLHNRILTCLFSSHWAWHGKSEHIILKEIKSGP